MKRFKYLSVLLIIIPTIIFSGCLKKKANSYIDFKPYLRVAGDYANTQQLTTRLINTVIKASSDSLLNTTGVNPDIDKAKCTFVHDTVSDSSFYELEYNWWGTIDPYERRRGGTIRVALDGPASDSGVSGSISLIHFHYEFDSLRATGFRMYNLGKLESGNRAFRFSADSMIWQVDTNKLITWRFDQIYEQLGAGIDSGFLISGNFTGQATNRYSFSAAIADSARLADYAGCAWLKNGTVIITASGLQNSGMLFPPDDQCINYYQFWIDDNRFDGAIEDFSYKGN